MLELRSILSWRLWDRWQPAIDACAAKAPATLICWYRFDVEIDTTGSPAELKVMGGTPLRCRSTDFTGTNPEPDVADQLACLEAAMGAVDGVYVPDSVVDELPEYRGPLDVEIVLNPSRIKGRARDDLWNRHQ